MLWLAGAPAKQKKNRKEKGKGTGSGFEVWFAGILVGCLGIFIRWKKWKMKAIIRRISLLVEEEGLGWWFRWKWSVVGCFYAGFRWLFGQSKSNRGGSGLGF